MRKLRKSASFSPLPLILITATTNKKKNKKKNLKKSYSNRAVTSVQKIWNEQFNHHNSTASLTGILRRRPFNGRTNNIIPTNDARKSNDSDWNVWNDTHRYYRRMSTAVMNESRRQSQIILSNLYSITSAMTIGNDSSFVYGDLPSTSLNKMNNVKQIKENIRKSSIINNLSIGNNKKNSSNKDRSNNNFGSNINYSNCDIFQKDNGSRKKSLRSTSERINSNRYLTYLYSKQKGNDVEASGKISEKHNESGRAKKKIGRSIEHDRRRCFMFVKKTVRLPCFPNQNIFNNII
ncbi:hypothetical protein SNEBB_000770 [Seison nebaliae]|nr:hypothetical protein SNEBB_000770 [Seison nebaliae]